MSEQLNNWTAEATCCVSLRSDITAKMLTLECQNTPQWVCCFLCAVMPVVRMHASALSTTYITQDEWQVAKSFAGFAMDFACYFVLSVHMQTIAGHHAQSGCLPFHLRTLVALIDGTPQVVQYRVQLK